MKQLPPPRRLAHASSLVVTAVLSLALAGSAHALSVDLIVPETDPAEVYPQVRIRFLAVAWDEQGNDVSDRATFTWTFPDAKEPIVGNPVLHRFPELGKFLVAVTATLDGDSGCDQTTVIVIPYEGGGLRQVPGVDDFTFTARYGAHVFGSEVCHEVALVVEQLPQHLLPFEWVVARFYRWENGQWVLKQNGMPDGGVASYGWTSTFDPNEAVSWRTHIELDEVAAEPPNTISFDLDDSWTPDNTVVKATGDPLILHHAEDTAHTIGWTITHCDDLDPVFAVTVTICDLAGNTVATLTVPDAGVGAGSVVWNTNLPEENGIYTYKIQADHPEEPPLPHPCVDQDKSTALTVTEVTVDEVDFQSRFLTLACDVQYTLSRAAGDAWLAVYGPDLVLKLEDDSIPVSAGQQEAHVEFEMAGNKIGTYYFVVHAEETVEDGAAHRDGQPKPALQQGAMTTILARALNMYGRTSMGLGGYDEAKKAHDEQEHAQQGTDYPPPPYDATITGHEVAPVFWRLSSLGEEENPNPYADAIFWYLGHADPGVLYTDQQTIGTKHMLFSGDGTNDDDGDIFYMGNMPEDSLERCALVMLLGCSTAVDPDGEGGDPSILQAFMDKGAACGIGSSMTIYPPNIRLLSNYFWEYICEDVETIEDAFDDALGDSNVPRAWFTHGNDELNVVGSGDSTLRPGRYQ